MYYTMYGARGRPHRFATVRTPLIPSLALKKSVPFTFVSSEGNPPLDQKMSLMNSVPDAVPSLPQLVAGKNRTGRIQRQAIHLGDFSWLRPDRIGNGNGVDIQHR